MDSLVALFCFIDDFCKLFEPAWERQLLTRGQRKRRRATGISLSELITLVILFHQTRYRQFKAFYLNHVHAFLRHEFPTLPSLELPRFDGHILNELNDCELYLRNYSILDFLINPNAVSQNPWAINNR